MECNCEKEKTDLKIYESLILPEGLEKVGETPWMNEKNVFPDILKNICLQKISWVILL